MFTATKKIILIQGKINQGLRKVLTKNIYADQLKYPHPSHNFSNVPPLRTIIVFCILTPSQNKILKNNGLLMSWDPGKGCH